MSDPKQANSLGIEVVYQDLALCDNLDVVHNMFLGREQTKRMVLDEITMERRATKTLQGLSVRTLKSVRQQVSSLSGGQRQTCLASAAAQTRMDSRWQMSSTSSKCIRSVFDPRQQTAC